MQDTAIKYLQMDADWSRVPARSMSYVEHQGKPGEFALQRDVGGRVLAPVAEAV